MVRRREVLLGAGTGAILALSGCSSTPTQESAPEPTFGYPEGFSEDGIESFSLALGSESANYRANSLSFDGERTYRPADSDGARTTTVSSLVNVENRTSYYRTETDTQVQETYIDETKNWRQTESHRIYDKRTEETEFGVGSIPFNKRTAYLIDRFERRYKGVEFEATEITDEDRLRYVATKSDLPGDHTLFQEYDNLSSARLELFVDQRGRVRKTVVDVETADGDELTHVTEFSGFDETTVPEPDWLEKAIQADQG
ncbi:MAG: hypothetical protein ACQEQJ_03330 [Halobacteriota archaeon]